MTKITIEVTPDQHKQIKMAALKQDKTIKDYLLEGKLDLEDRPSRASIIGLMKGKIWIEEGYDIVGPDEELVDVMTNSAIFPDEKVNQDSKDRE